MMAEPENIDDLEISIRAWNCLRNGTNIRTVEQLTQVSARDLLGIANFGKVSLCEIKEALHEYGLALSSHDCPKNHDGPGNWEFLFPRPVLNARKFIDEDYT